MDTGVSGSTGGKVASKKRKDWNKIVEEEESKDGKQDEVSHLSL